MHNISLIYFIRKYFVIQKHLLHFSSNFFNDKKKLILLHRKKMIRFETNSISKKRLKDDRIFLRRKQEENASMPTMPHL